MNTTTPARRTSTTTRRTRVTFATLAAALCLGAGLTACSGAGADEAGDTTCGEYTAYSAAEKRNFIRDAAKTDDSVDADTKKLIESATDDQVDIIAAEFVTACESEDADTKLDDVE